MKSDKFPPHIEGSDKVILFDGVCKLCNAWSQFIINHDHKRCFKLCSVQSDEGKDILRYFGMPTCFYDTMLYVEGSQCFQKSEAFFQIMANLGYPWKTLCVFRLVPNLVRNWLYDRIALNRYRLFGRYTYCHLPLADHQGRFIDAKK
ncbi:thiol-disulfide oxidoreductase DCC family protein [Aurantivibrio plasticivorans]